MADLSITHQNDGSRGKYRACSDQGDCGHMTWFEQSPGVRVVDHTFVPPSLRGGGIAARLVEAVVADARTEGFRIVPQCSYVAAAFRRRPDWSDLRA